jgi:sensor c-di-GMP phosphodiesterase-like protein
VAENAGFIGELTLLVMENLLHDSGEMLLHESLHLTMNIFAADLTDEGFSRT